jgi:hypothetical protein
VTHWFPDTSVLVNFGHIDRLDLLKGFLRGNGKITQAVSREIVASTAWVRPLEAIEPVEWFGDVIRVIDNVGAVEGLRRNIFGGTKHEPLEHLGESETLHVIRTDPAYGDAVWITEDRSAFEFGKRNGIVTRNTFNVFQDLVAFGDVSKAEGFRALQYLDGIDRLMYCPSSDRELD